MDLLERLGLGGRRVLLLHHDDLGLSHAQNGAYQALGFPTGSVMVPGAWAGAVRGEDLGVHLTLTSEWPAPRMRPLTGGESLRDEAGYFPASLEALWQRARAEEVERELKAQIEAASRLFRPTHLDAHQGAVLRPDLAEVYLRLAQAYRLPPLLPQSLEGLGVPPLFLPDLERLLAQAPFPRVRLLDPYGLPPEERLGFYLGLAALPPGLYQLLHHSALPTPEGRALPDWRTREADYFALAHPEVRRILAEFHPLTWGAIREAL
ncbi:ChbG/HpnK family deacetylase [Thermus thermamylovorans]|uniref:ChbG/HpnK family deacetylase n=1 Tax=Thermus thermamylovorans TaxID=2509362 RepID=A0A4Q9B6M3_9DEIN|nr:ChbG/HpnK family deacetylase [Thermus thermamylovorans]TBH21344.1 ChbG/HpnK family deacetylase [Thermus thermamylovorans]